MTETAPIIARRGSSSQKSTGDWKQTVSETMRHLQIIPEKFNGKVVVVLKEGGVSYLERTETRK